VDDNSDPEKVGFDEFRSLNDSFTEVILTKEDKGAGYARNVGLSKAQSKWILFADADDFFVDKCFENVIDKYVNSEFDIIYFGLDSCYSDTFEPAQRHIAYLKLVHDFRMNNNISQDTLRYRFVPPYSKLIRHQLIQDNNILFDETKYANDVLFSTLTGHYARTIWAEIKPIYCITVSKGSLVNIRSKEMFLNRYMVKLRKNKFLKSVQKSDYQDSIMFHMTSSLKYGLIFFMRFVMLAIKYRANIFVGYNRWFNTWIKMNRKKSVKKRVTISE
jgi:glycosyltransferase involved in cell wall biosynthesis